MKCMNTLIEYYSSKLPAESNVCNVSFNFYPNVEIEGVSCLQEATVPSLSTLVNM